MADPTTAGPLLVGPPVGFSLLVSNTSQQPVHAERPRHPFWRFGNDRRSRFTQTTSIAAVDVIGDIADAEDLDGVGEDASSELDVA